MITTQEGRANRRTTLEKLSEDLKQTAKESASSINAALLFHYTEETGQTAQDFKPLSQWNVEGYGIKKGEKSYMIWSKPENRTINKKDGLIGQEPEVIKVYNITHLFHIGQVSKRQQTA